VEELLSQAINNISGISAYDSIKRQLSRNLMDLQKNSFSATDEIIVKLDTLMETVENLPQIPNQFQDFNKNKPAESQKDEQSNTGLIANIKNVLQKAVIIQPKYSVPAFKRRVGCYAQTTRPLQILHKRGQNLDGALLCRERFTKQ
jgi:hypothetical protein